MPVPDFLVRPLEVLVVDNDRIFGESLAMFLSDGELVTVTDIACDLDGALDATSARHFVLALVDVRLDAESGFHVVGGLRAYHPGLPTLLMSALDKSAFIP